MNSLKTSQVCQYGIHNDKPIFTKPCAVLILALICSIIWGISYPCVKIGYTLFQIETTDIISKSLFAGVRFTIAGVVTIIYGSMRNKKLITPSLKNIKGICLLSFFQTIFQYMFIYIGLANTQASKGSILNQTGAFLLVVFSPFIYREEGFRLKKVIGCILGFLGIIIINIDLNLDLSFKIIGEGFVILSSIFAAIGYIVSKKISQNSCPIMITGYQQLLGGVFLTVIGFAGGGHLYIKSVQAIGLLVFLSISVAVVYVLWMLLLKYNEVSKISMFKFGVPIFGVIFSGILLGEQILNIRNIMATVFVSAGILIVNYVGRRGVENIFDKE